MTFIEKPINGRYLTQDDRIEIADGLAAGRPVKSIANNWKQALNALAIHYGDRLNATQ